MAVRTDARNPCVGCGEELWPRTDERASDFRLRRCCGRPTCRLVAKRLAMARARRLRWPERFEPEPWPEGVWFG